jgi:biopolymer transport protein ExbD
MIFFLVTAHFVRSSEREPVDLPSATQAEREEHATHRLVLTVLKNGSFHIGGNPVTLDEFESALVGSASDSQELHVQIRADKNVLYGTIEPVLLMCARHGVQNVGFKVFEDRE